MPFVVGMGHHGTAQEVPLDPGPPARAARARAHAPRTRGDQVLEWSRVPAERKAAGEPAAFGPFTVRLLPALTGLDHPSGACDGQQCKGQADHPSPDELLHQSHRMPAPTDNAIAASIARAQVKRVSLAFTKHSLSGMKDRHSWAGNRAVSLRSLALRPRLATGLP